MVHKITQKSLEATVRQVSTSFMKFWKLCIQMLFHHGAKLGTPNITQDWF